jgi:ankyrin repeat protein
MFGRRSASPCRCLAAAALGIMVLASLTTAQGEPAASPNQQLLAAAEHGNLTALQDAIAEGADVNGRGTNGLPPLLALFHSARGQLDADHRECITALLQAGAAVDALDGDRRTPLILAARLGDRPLSCHQRRPRVAQHQGEESVRASEPLAGLICAASCRSQHCRPHTHCS